jgi:hypothetical protein
MVSTGGNGDAQAFSLSQRIIRGSHYYLAA